MRWLPDYLHFPLYDVVVPPVYHQEHPKVARAFVPTYGPGWAVRPSAQIQFAIITDNLIDQGMSAFIEFIPAACDRLGSEA